MSDRNSDHNSKGKVGLSGLRSFNWPQSKDNRFFIKTDEDLQGWCEQFQRDSRDSCYVLVPSQHVYEVLVLFFSGSTAFPQFTKGSAAEYFVRVFAESFRSPSFPQRVTCCL